MRILSLNAGSSTLKFGLFEAGTELLRGSVDRLGREDGVLKVQGAETKAVSTMDVLGAVTMAIDLAGRVDAVGSRVVHGGDRFERATLVTPPVVACIRELAPLAPLHNPRDADVLEAVEAKLPGVPTVAVFDTSFHRTLPPLASTYALPRELSERLSIRRYGFHGISYRYVTDRMAAELGTSRGRWIICHLGNGASVCAARDGVSVETSMGMTPLEGLVMGTRSGDIDPGLILYLARSGGMSIDQIDDLLNHGSGLLGVSGKSQDVQDLEKAVSDGDKVADFSLDLFAYRVAKYIGAYSVVLEGVDALVFCGGIGENSSDIRRRICKRLGSLGISIPEEPISVEGVQRVSGSEAPGVWIVRTDEEKQIAVETLETISR